MPGDEAKIVITAAGLDALSPSTTINVPFYLCNVGTTAGTVTAVTTPVIAAPLGTAAGAELTGCIENRGYARPLGRAMLYPGTGPRSVGIWPENREKNMYLYLFRRIDATGLWRTKWSVRACHHISSVPLVVFDADAQEHQSGTRSGCQDSNVYR